MFQNSEGILFSATGLSFNVAVKIPITSGGPLAVQM